MSGFLEVKYPFKSNLGFPFKSWKKQWCILRPSPTFSGCILAVYCSEAGASAGTIELPCGFVVRRAKSRTRPHAFAVFPADEPRKPRVLLAANTLQDTLSWMEKIRSFINGNNIVDTPLKDSYSVTVNLTDLSRQCGLNNTDGTVTLSSTGVLVTRSQKQGLFIDWKYINGATISKETDRNGICILNVDRGFTIGGGELHFSSPLATELTEAVKRAIARQTVKTYKKLSKSEGDLRTGKCTDSDGEIRRTSWYSGPSEVSLDDLDIVMSKECPAIKSGTLSRCEGATLHTANQQPIHKTTQFDDSVSDRRSLVSVASGTYEEIPDVADDNVYLKMTRDRTRGLIKVCEEPMYEAVGECTSLYATVRRRRHHPPPLPPRHTQVSGSWVSVWALGGAAREHARPPDRWDRSRQAFTAFRKRLKSDSRTAVSPKSEMSKDKDIETKKKKFDFPPTRDIFKSFKVSRKMKNLKITNNLSKSETKSCEFLDDAEHVTANRCSKSVECLESNNEYFDGYDANLSIEMSDEITALSLPKELVEIIIKEKVLINDKESDYVPMSPIVPQAPMEHHYIVMSPRTNIA